MPELTPPQIAILERLAAHGFQISSFPFYEKMVGVRKENCAALLEPVPGDGLKLFRQPFYLLDGKLSVQVDDGGRRWFVWKKRRLEATPERRAEIDRFSAEISALLASHG